MFDTKRYDIIAFPNGARTTVASVYRTDAAHAVYNDAAFQAADRAEYVDVFDGDRRIATIGPDGECVAFDHWVSPSLVRIA